MQGVAVCRMFLNIAIKGQAKLWLETTGERLGSCKEMRESFLQEFANGLAKRVKEQKAFQRYWRERV